MRESARRTRALLTGLLLLVASALIAHAGEVELPAPLPVDPQVRIERLPNGLECWLRPHGTPPNRVAIWLHVGRIQPSQVQPLACKVLDQRV